ncbi:MAG: carboxypeptidase-like regulatory domain-containing protein, partial [Sphingobacteriaceae bacterium]|nr:carboxypeptidase-like regulatory domain-containing protein [Cytophagaceae bacterium]
MKKAFYVLGKTTLLGLACVAWLTTAALAQDRRVSGKVTNGTDNQPVAGATVQVKGTNTGVAADASGSYAITVRGADDVLVLSAVGFSPLEVRVGNQSVINVSLREDAASLSEVVVTGYSSQSKRDITGAVATVTPKDLLSIPATDVSQQLQGRVAGVTVINDATPGGS